MVWSKIKKAINSTLGTNNFKPLDKIVEESFNKVVEKQNEMKTALETGDNNYITGYVKNGANIETGTYLGTGTYGQKNPNSLLFFGNPQIVIIGNAVSHYEMIAFRERNVGFVVGVGGGPGADSNDARPVWHSNKIVWGENSISWYGEYDEFYQLNDDYNYYIAITKIGE